MYLIIWSFRLTQKKCRSWDRAAAMGLCSSAESFEGANTAQGGLRGSSTGGGASAAAAMIGGNALCSQIEMFVSCQNLKNLDNHSKSDPFVVLEELDTRSNTWREVGRSEIIVNSLNPEFVKRFKYTYRFEENQRIRCRDFDADDDSANTNTLDLSRQDRAGDTPQFTWQMSSTASIKARR